jgi:hypothetical protein
MVNCELTTGAGGPVLFVVIHPFRRHPRGGGDPGHHAPVLSAWIPAFAGMTP